MFRKLAVVAIVGFHTTEWNTLFTFIGKIIVQTRRPSANRTGKRKYRIK